MKVLIFNTSFWGNTEKFDKRSLKSNVPITGRYFEV